MAGAEPGDSVAGDGPKPVTRPGSQDRRPPPAEPSHTGRFPPRNRGPSQRLLTRITGQETAACQGLARRRAPAACARAAERSGPGKGGRLPGGGQPAPGHSGPDLGVCAPDPQRPGQAMVCIQARLWSVATPAYDLQAGLAKAGYGRRRLIRRFRCGNRSVRSQGAGRPQQRRRGGGGKQRLCGPSQPRRPGRAGPDQSLSAASYASAGTRNLLGSGGLTRQEGREWQGRFAAPANATPPCGGGAERAVTCCALARGLGGGAVTWV